MSTAHNHRLRAATPDELAERPGDNGFCVSTRLCVGSVRFFAGYDFATGRPDSTGHREIAVCTAHARQFSAKYGVPMPEEVGAS